METTARVAYSTTSSDIIKALDHFHHQIVANGPAADQILDAQKKHPDSASLQLYTALFYLFGQEVVADTMARQHLYEAEKQLRQFNSREQLLLEAAKLWLNKDYSGAIIILKAITEQHPTDTLALKLAEWLYYCNGQAFEAKPYLALCESLADANKQDPYFLSMHSFALELTGNLNQAKEVAEHAIEIHPIMPWGQHTLAHYYLNSGEIDAGIKRLEGFKPSWDRALSLLRSHNTWHLALMYIAKRQKDETLSFFSDIFGALPDTCGEQIDATSLLWRLDMAGIAEPTHFKQVIDHLGNHPFEQYTGFNTAHYIYALSRTGKQVDADKAVDLVKAYGQALPLSHHKDLWLQTILPWCKGINAFGAENYALAHDYLTPVIQACPQLGGSDAQIELFKQTYLVCLLKLKKHQDAKQYFDNELRHYQHTALADYWFSE